MHENPSQSSMANTAELGLFHSAILHTFRDISFIKPKMGDGVLEGWLWYITVLRLVVYLNAEKNIIPPKCSPNSQANNLSKSFLCLTRLWFVAIPKFCIFNLKFLDLTRELGNLRIQQIHFASQLFWHFLCCSRSSFKNIPLFDPSLPVHPLRVSVLCPSSLFHCKPRNHE